MAAARTIAGAAVKLAIVAADPRANLRRDIDVAFLMCFLLFDVSARLVGRFVGSLGDGLAVEGTDHMACHCHFDVLRAALK